MTHALIQKLCVLEPAAENLLKTVFETKKLSARSYDRIIKVGRTIADLAGGGDTISAGQIAEAVKFRSDFELDT